MNQRSQTEEDAPVFHLPTPNSEWMEWHWMIHPDSSPILLSLATSKSAKLRASPAVNSSILPTKHLNLPSNFYEDPKRLTQLAAYLQPDHILPRYGEFIFKTLLRANAMQYLFQYQDPKPTCVFCRVNETYEHFLFSCGYGQSVWYYFKAIQRLLECSFPSTCLEMFYETPKPADGYYIRGYLKIWPIVRACVYYQIWLQRADRTFRPDLTAKSPMEVAIHAASLIKLHLQQLLVDLPLKKGYAKVFNVLKRLSSDPCYFADDSQLYAANETCLHRQLALVRTFCDKSGFRLNVDKTQILTYSQLNGTLASLQVTSDSPVKALGILVAPNLSPLARFNYVFEKFVARLSLWLYKARTMAGKVTILHSICLPVLWYQLAFVPADKDLAKKIDKVMLQFMHGEEINPSSSVHGLRLIKKEIIFMPKKSGGFGLHHALALWQQHNRSVMIRCMQAITTPPRKSAMSAWITPGYTLLEHAFHPWGSPRDLLLANGTSAFIRQLYKNPNITPMWKALLSSWFDSRWTPYGCPNHISSLDVPLWHNSYLPGLEDLYDQCSTSTQDQANVLASLHITKLSHLLTPCQRVWPASILFDKINRACRQANFVPPTKQWISILVTKLSRLFDIVSEEDAPVFHLPTPNSEWMEWHWMIHPDSSPILLSLATSKSAKLRASPAVNSSILPTKHLNLPSNFYEDPKRLTQLAAYLQPDHILPRYGEFIFKTLLRANAMQYL
ncbi:hypothetical protein Ae201684P_016944 [Aphanomyces euteiches]|nr:hypothetical protein Ae201684P_016944 [Aphanomyces euteiches]